MPGFQPLPHMIWVKVLTATNELFKEDFNKLIPRQFDSRIDFVFEILKIFSLETAVTKNYSFISFVARYHLAPVIAEKAIPNV